MSSQKISQLIQAKLAELIELRHELHANPELSFEEYETSKRLLTRLQKIPGLKVESGVAKTGIVATLGAEKKGPCIALRADMDALPIQETTGKPYASKSPGKMHACGHDGHMTCLLGAAMVLSELQNELHGPVKFFFQPAEEGGGGAKRMCDEGALQKPKVEAVFGLHGWPGLEVGKIATRPGSFFASYDDFKITINGVGTHAAFPHTGIDPILIASHVIVALQSIASRSTDPLESVVLTVGKIEAGTASNIIPSTATMIGTIRTLHPEIRKKSLALLQQITNKTAEAFGGSATIAIENGYPVLMNDPKASEFIAKVGAGVLGKEAIIDAPPVMGAEDFAYFTERARGAFWVLGLCPKGSKNYPYLHQPNFDFSDDAIPVGVRMHCELALQFSQNV